jgi:mono/diheme cytochrome c family protein
MRARTLLLSVLGLGVAVVATRVLAQKGTGVAPRGPSPVMTYSGPRGMPTNEEGQPATLPPLPAGVTQDLIRQGDALFHDTGGCYTCHGAEANGMPDKGSGLTLGVNFQQDNFPALDSTITLGIPEPVTRTTIAMPARGLSGNMNPQQVQALAAYVWAISHTRGEPWPGGHANHGQAAATTTPANAHGTQQQ